MNVAEAVGRTRGHLGVRQVFGVVDSGNFHVTNALIAARARFVVARHEHGAAVMADAYSRATGEVSVASLHQAYSRALLERRAMVRQDHQLPVVVLAHSFADES